MYICVWLFFQSCHMISIIVFHIISGKKSDHPLSPEFIPSIFAYSKTPEKTRSHAAVAKFHSRQEMKRRKRDQEDRTSAATSLLAMSQSGECDEDDDNETAAPLPPSKYCDTGTQTDMSGTDIDNVFSECDNLRTNLTDLREHSKKSSLEKDSFENDDSKINFYTGLPNFIVLMAVYNLVLDYLNPNMKMSTFHQLLSTLMRLRLGLNIKYLAYTFGVSVSTMSKVQQETLHVLYRRLVPILIIWPEREVLRSNLPVAFRSKFQKCASIIDCFEIFTEKASDFNARSQTFSSYKNHNTIKYLIGITPQGVISFISKGWGGRTSDKMITENCGYLDLLLPGDLILADRGFDVGDAIGLCAANLSIPAFTKGTKQLDPCDVEATRGLASVRIHVERVIGMVRQKYSILSSTIPITLLQSDDTGLTTLDKMVHVCSSLVNLCEPIVPFD